MSQQSQMSDYEVAVAFERTVIYEGDINKAMRYAHPSLKVNEAPSTPYRTPIVGADGLRQLREDVNGHFIFEGEARTRYYLAEPGLVVGTIERDARLRHSTEPFTFRVTEWIHVTDGLVSEVDVYYFENAPLARAAEAAGAVGSEVVNQQVTGTPRS